MHGKAKGDLDGAIADYSRVIDLTPRQAEAYSNRGSAKRAKGELDGAIADFNKAIESDPKQASAYNNRGAIKARREISSAQLRTISWQSKLIQRMPLPTLTGGHC